MNLRAPVVLLAIFVASCAPPEAQPLLPQAPATDPSVLQNRADQAIATAVHDLGRCLLKYERTLDTGSSPVLSQAIVDLSMCGAEEAELSSAYAIGLEEADEYQALAHKEQIHNEATKMAVDAVGIHRSP